MPTTTRSRRHVCVEDLVLTFGPTATVGTGEAGLLGGASSATVLSLSTGLFYDIAGAAWGAAVLNPMAPASGSMADFNVAGPIPAADISIATVGRDLLVKYMDASAPDPYTEFEHITLYNYELDELETDHIIAGSYGELMKVIASLSFRFYKQDNCLYNAEGQLTSCDIHVWATAAAMAGAPLYTFTWTTTYAGGLPIESVSS